MRLNISNSTIQNLKTQNSLSLMSKKSNKANLGGWDQQVLWIFALIILLKILFV